MRISEVLEITRADLLNRPAISAFSGISTRIDGLKRGELFLARNNTLIDEALYKGAYGVIFSGQITMHDEEIAWLRVDSVAEATLRFCRYILMSGNTKVVLLSKIEWKIAKNLAHGKELLFFNGDSLELLEVLQKDNYEWIFFCDEVFERVAPSVIRAEIPSIEPFGVIAHTLFESRIRYEEQLITLPLPRIFLKPLSSVVSLFKTYGIEFDIVNFEAIDALFPCFLNTRNKITKQGQSNRVVIAEMDFDSFGQYITYLTLNARWARILFLVPQPYFELFENIGHTKSYSSKEELLRLIEHEEYNFALALGVNLAFLQERLKEARQEASLF